MDRDAYQETVDALAQGKDGMHITCPHCKSRALIRSSRELSALVREAYCQCTNLACGHTFKIVVEAVQTISPSAVPDQDPSIVARLNGHPLHPPPTPQRPCLPPMTP